MTAALARDYPTAVTRRPVTVRPAPRREPPFDDEREQLATVTRLDRTLPLAMPDPAPQPWRLPPVSQHALPDPESWARRLLLGMIESAGGHRPLNQLAAFLAAPVHRGITADFERTNAAGQRHWLHHATVGSVHVSAPAADVLEMCAVLRVGPRARAVAMRIELRHDRWSCTRLQLG